MIYSVDDMKRMLEDLRAAIHHERERFTIATQSGNDGVVTLSAVDAVIAKFKERA